MMMACTVILTYLNAMKTPNPPMVIVAMICSVNQRLCALEVQRFASFLLQENVCHPSMDLLGGGATRKQE
jgi:hypothetical protein